MLIFVEQVVQNHENVWHFIKNKTYLSTTSTYFMGKYNNCITKQSSVSRSDVYTFHVRWQNYRVRNSSVLNILFDGFGKECGKCLCFGPWYWTIEECKSVKHEPLIIFLLSNFCGNEYRGRFWTGKFCDWMVGNIT